MHNSVLENEIEKISVWLDDFQKMTHPCAYSGKKKIFLLLRATYSSYKWQDYLRLNLTKPEGGLAICTPQGTDFGFICDLYLENVILTNKIEIDPTPPTTQYYNLANWDEFISKKNSIDFQCDTFTTEEIIYAGKTQLHHEYILKGKWEYDDSVIGLYPNDSYFELELDNENKTKANCSYKKSNANNIRCSTLNKEDIKFKNNFVYFGDTYIFKFDKFGEEDEQTDIPYTSDSSSDSGDDSDFNTDSSSDIITDSSSDGRSDSNTDGSTDSSLVFLKFEIINFILALLLF
jgi:hypothetical protein